ncbi:MAG: GNAT family N-acetyltransferase [Nocardioides sp.]
MTQQTLHTERLTLRPLSDDHLEHEVLLDADPEVLRYLSLKPRTREEVERSHAFRLEQGREVDGLGVWAGFLRAEPDRFVGIWMLQPPHGPSQPKVPGEADIGYRLLRAFWRQGLAKEGSRELMRYGFEDVGLKRIFAQTMAVNTPSRATMASLGMTFVRSFHEDFDEPIEGRDQGEVEYDMTRAAWDVMAR